MVVNIVNGMAKRGILEASP